MIVPNVTDGIYEALEAVLAGERPSSRMATLHRKGLVEHLIVFASGHELTLAELGRMSGVARQALGNKTGVRVRLSGWGCACLNVARRNRRNRAA